jgi:hypothetical protein
MAVDSSQYLFIYLYTGWIAQFTANGAVVTANW